MEDIRITNTTVYAIKCTCGQEISSYMPYFNKRKNEEFAKLQAQGLPIDNHSLSHIFEEIGFDLVCCRKEIHKSNVNPEVIPK
jgi:DNA-directed RNA polymerase subunit N (RpoN/RPB10)